MVRCLFFFVFFEICSSLSANARKISKFHAHVRKFSVLFFYAQAACESSNPWRLPLSRVRAGNGVRRRRRNA
jgi:hypothetical protein